MSAKVKVFAAILALGAVAGGGYWYYTTHQSHDFKLYGNVDIRQVDLAFLWPERIKTVLVEEGDLVKKGQILATQDTDTLLLQIKQAEATVAANYQAYLIQKNGSRPEEIDQAKAAVEAAEAKLVLSQKDLDRISGIYKATRGQGVSKQQVDSAQAQVNVDKSQLISQQKALELAKIGPRKEAVQQAFEQWQAAKAELDLLQLKLKQSKLTSPLDATIRSRYLQPGDMASSASPVFALAISSPKWVRAYVNEVELGKIKPGQEAFVSIDTYPNKKIDGKVGFISSVAEFTPKTVQTPDLRTNLVYEVRIIVDDKDNVLRLGMPATVSFER